VNLYLHRKANHNKVHVGGALWNEVPPGILEEQFKSADVIHFHNYAWDLKIFETYPNLLEVAKSKPCLIQYHSPRRSIENFEHSIEDKSLKHAVIAQYHVREYPECEFVVPNVIPIDLPLYQGAGNKWLESVTCVSYTPSSTNGVGWDDKGWAFTEPVLTKLDDEGYIIKDVCTNVPYEACMKRKRWAHIGIDEIMTGSYHLSTLEYFSLGCACIVRIDEKTLNAIFQISPEGAAAWPGIQASPDTLEAQIKLWVSNRDALKARAEKSREWMEKYWSPANHALHFEGVYKCL
jgi:hypothetical protein